MGEDHASAVVFDANVIISSLIRETGLNRYVVVLAPLIYPCFYPDILRVEIFNHIEEVARKAKKCIFEIKLGIDKILEPLRAISSREITKYISASRSLVNDPDDALYVASALYLRHRASYRQSIIITWNKRDYIIDKLLERWIRVLNPKEFYNNYLSTPRVTSTIVYKGSNITDAVQAALSHIRENKYVVLSEKPGYVEIETPCHHITIERDEKKQAFAIKIRRLKLDMCI